MEVIMYFEIIFDYREMDGCVKIIEHNKSTNKSLWSYEYNIKYYDNKLYRVMDNINTCCPELSFKEFSILTEYFRQFCWHFFEVLLLFSYQRRIRDEVHFRTL